MKKCNINAKYLFKTSFWYMGPYSYFLYTPFVNHSAVLNWADLFSAQQFYLGYFRMSKSKFSKAAKDIFKKLAHGN